MAYNVSRRVDLGSLLRAPFAALQWRLLLLWVLLLLVPTAVVSLPLWRSLSGLLDHSVHATAWAQSFHAMMFGDVVSQLGQHNGWVGGAGFAGLLVTVLLLPLLNGMVVASGRAGRALTFGHLLQSGMIEYGRMFRLMLWSLLPYAVVIGGTALAFTFADKQAEKAVLESQADSSRDVALFVLCALFVLAQVVMESARASFIVDVGLRSATRAFGRGFMQLLRRPFSSLLGYLLVTAICLGIALLLGRLRVATPAIGAGGFVLALLLTELAVVVTGWMHVARVFVLARVAVSLNPSRRAGGIPSAL